MGIDFSNLIFRKFVSAPYRAVDSPWDEEQHDKIQLKLEPSKTNHVV